MSSTDSQSGLLPVGESGLLPTGDGFAASSKAKSPKGIWLNGDVLACACPECGAPMSIRLWLMLADCWMCGTSIELTEEQEREARRLLAEREAKPTPPPIPSPARELLPAPSGRAAGGEGKLAPQPAPALKPQPKPKPQPSPAPPKASVKPATRSASGGPPATKPATRQPHWLIPDLTAWLTSLVFHLVLLIVLSLWLIDRASPEDLLVLSTQVGRHDEPGGIPEDLPSLDPLEFDDAGDVEPHDVETTDPFEMPPDTNDDFTAEAAAEQSPFDLPEQIVAGGGLGTILVGRDPRVRSEVVLQEGGTSYTEAAVARGLVWLARHQNLDGSWSLNGFSFAAGCDCGSAGVQSDTGGTALALLPFLGAGQTHVSGEYKETVGRGLAWLVANQGPDGDLRGIGSGVMYAHGQAAIALCEAYALTRDPQLLAPAQRAIDFIVAAQHAGGGWRYQPREPGDTSVVGWQMMALRSAQMAYLQVPDKTFESASLFLDTVQTDTPGGLYTYMPGGGESPAMTAEALLCRQYGGWPRDHKGMNAGVRYLLGYLPSEREPNLYYWYYASQVMHHVGGEPWKTWNESLRSTLVAMQETEGHAAGSWSPRGGHDIAGGRVYMTALSVCTLEVYYRHMPLYSREAVRNEPGAVPQ